MTTQKRIAAATAIQTVIQLPPQPKPRPEWIRQLGVQLHPEAVTDAWYAADCPRQFKPDVGSATLLRWRVSRFLRGTR